MAFLPASGLHNVSQAYSALLQTCKHSALPARLQTGRRTSAVCAARSKGAPGPNYRIAKTPAGKMAQGRKVTIAVEGCCHGQLDAIYDTLQHLERVEGRKVDLLICCGDFQAVRNLDDLETMSVPLKYRDMGTFYKYYSGEKRAPVPTLFIGGNHEAPNYLWELYYGGWAAPNIYFMGYAGVVRFAGLRIAGLSGIYSQAHYGMGHFERPPYNPSSIRSAYHVRELEVQRLLQIRQPLDIFLSHDWPQWITLHGNKDNLFRRKPFFQKEAERGDLGSPANQQLMDTLQPAYWFSAHLHCKFAAVVPHGAAAASASAQQQQDSSSSGQGTGGRASTTRFLALDKCLPNRDFLQVVELDAQGPLELEYDEEWLAIVRKTHHCLSLNKQAPRLPQALGDLTDEVAEVQRLLAASGSSSRIPDNFQQTAEAYRPAGNGRLPRGNMPARPIRNPQTVALLELLGLPYNLDPAGSRQQPNTAAYAASGPGSGGGISIPLVAASNPEEIDLDDNEEDVDGQQEDAMFAPVDLDFAKS